MISVCRILLPPQAEDALSESVSQQLLEAVAASGWQDACNSVADAHPPAAPAFGSVLTDSLSCDWHTRMALATAMPEVTETDILAKYTEIGNISKDFNATASRLATLIVRQRGTRFVGTPS